MAKDLFANSGSWYGSTAPPERGGKVPNTAAPAPTDVPRPRYFFAGSNSHRAAAETAQRHADRLAAMAAANAEGS